MRRIAMMCALLVLGGCDGGSPLSDGGTADGGGVDGGQPEDGGIVACTTDAECDDGAFCNGVEVCGGDSRVCERGAPPCGGAGCDETSDTCLPDDCVVSDTDGDGFVRVACGGDDCDDARSGVNPDASEVCDVLDQDCDGRVDEGVAVDCYPDDDGDGYSPAGESAVRVCGECGEFQTRQPPAVGRADCDDGYAGSGPDALETCDERDNDCDGRVDEDGSDIGMPSHCTGCFDGCQFSCVSGVCDVAAGVRVGEGSQCVWTASGRLLCWGSNGDGEVGIGTTLPVLDAPVQVDVTAALGGRTVGAVSAGDGTTCALSKPGSGSGSALACWGENRSGQAGVGTTTEVWLPTAVAGTGWTSVSVGGEIVCATDVSRRAYCWGRWVPLINPVSTERYLTNSTTPAVLPETGVDAIATGDRYGCMIRGGTAECWGVNGAGQVGVASTTFYIEEPTPVPVTGTVSRVELSLHGTACAVVDGDVWCWGDDTGGTVGDGPGSRDSCSHADGDFGCARAPTLAMEGPVQDLALGADAACALDGSGQAWCWGNNRGGVFLGMGLDVMLHSPTRVPMLDRFDDIELRENRACGMTDGHVWCWGESFRGRAIIGLAAHGPVVAPEAAP